MKKVLVVVCSFSLLLAAGACKKKEQPVPQPVMPAPQQQLPPGHPGMAPGGPGGPVAPGAPDVPGAPGAPGAPGNVIVPKGETTVKVPDAVKGKWKSVVLVVEDKEAKKSSEYTVNLNSELKIPNSNLKVAVGEFLPDFRMNGLEITSMSNDANNPAVGIKVFESGKQIFPAAGKKWGWLYAKFPTMHPFEHPKYAIGLKGGIKKG
ncbi:MAG TPA: hypothetical protein VLD55_00645 [Candidatus Sulfobium mesophilum]|nr:hypothetical protein [Candidatus Sulfobium mesophilum]